MPFTAITRDIAFSHSPIADSKVAVHFPATFKPADSFALCVFLHGKDVGVPIEKHIAAAVGQIKSSSTNTLLVAPRCGDDATDGRFRHTAEFSAFIDELGTVLPPVLTQAGMAQADANRIAGYAATKAPIVLVAFSGGWNPLNAILKGLLAIDPMSDIAKATRCVARVVGIALLDSIFGETSSSGPFEWQEARRAQTALVGIYGRTTKGAEASNRALIAKLKGLAPVKLPASWEAMGPVPAGTMAFFEVDTDHQLLPSNGPPAEPIATFLSALGDRLTSFPMV